MRLAAVVLVLAGASAHAEIVPLGSCGPIDRRHDHVEVIGSALQRLNKIPIGRFGVVAFRDGVARPIVFQLDERRGRKVVVEGPEVLKPDHRPGEFDYDDGIVVMPCDAGERPPEATRDAFMARAKVLAWREVQIEDTLTGRRGYVYVVVADTPPTTTARYADYGPGDAVRTAAYRIAMENALPTQLTLTDAGERNLLDGFRLRAEATYLANLLTATLTEQGARHRLLAWNSGAVRVTRRSQHDVHVALGVHLSAGVSHTYFYPLHIRGPGKMRLPISPGSLFTRVSAMAGVDMQGLEGWRYRHAGGTGELVIDGKPGPEEAHFAAPGPWFVVHGDDVAILTALRLSANLSRSLPVHLVYVDDATRMQPPERHVGSVPLVGYRMDAIERLPAGYYEFEFGVFILTGYRPGDERRVLDGFATPLHVTVTGRSASASAPAAAP